MAARQEVLNVLLAQLLQERGLVAAPEQVLAPPEEGRAMPDVLVDFQGLRLAIEGEVPPASPGGPAMAHKRARRAALRRVDQGVAHVGVALVYPSELRDARPESMKAELAASCLSFAVITERSQQQAYLLPEVGREPVPFSRGNLDALCEALRRAYEQLIRDEVLQQAVQRVETAMVYFLNAMTVQPASTWRFMEALELRGVRAESEEGTGVRQVRGGQPLSLGQRAAINRVAALVLINAMIFQEVLSRETGRVKGLDEFRNRENPVGDLAFHWEYILKEINYYPIFHIASEVMLSTSADRDMTAAIRRFLDTARCIVDWRVPLRHDLAGRLYHHFLSEAKYLGAYYTSIPAAEMLLKLALTPPRWGVDWSDLAALRRFRVADFACGTGTLLMAAADAILDNYIRARAVKGRALRLDDVNSALVSHTIYGFDVLDAAVHLTASTLSLRSPEIPINVTHLGKRALGGPHLGLGSLDLLESPELGALFSKPGWVVGQEGVARSEPKAQRLPTIDLCVMNPPFTRSVGGNLLFGNLPEGERAQLQRRLRDLVKARGLSASITAGLSPVFIALGDKYLKEGGRLALVLPRALLSGVAWRHTREMLERGYHLEWLVVSHQPDHWNFSENTNLSEVLVVARKRAAAEPGERVVCVNLWKQPANAVEALTVARVAQEEAAPDIATQQGVLDISNGGSKLGEAISVPWDWLKGRLWSLPCAFAQADLTRTLFHLLDGRVCLPDQPGPGKAIRLCRLKTLCELGFDCRDIHDGFSLARSVTPFTAFWSHDARRVTTLLQAPNRFLAPLPRAKEGRPLRNAAHLWQKASRILIAERLRLNTMRLTAVRTTRTVLSNVWWTMVPRDLSEEAQSALVLWLNSSLGLLTLMAHREETAGAWVKFKKPVLGDMPVLEVCKLGDRVRGNLADAFIQLSRRELLPFPRIARDPTRAAIDGALAEALGLPDLGPLREMLAREPILSLSLDSLFLH